VHAVAGLLWPAITLGSLALLGDAATGGRATFLPYAEGVVAWAPWTAAFFGLSFFLWLGTGFPLRFAFGTDEDLRRLRRFVAGPSAVFAAVHAWLVWGRVTFGGADARYLYVSLQSTLSQLTVAWIYAFGAALTALQLEQAARVLSETFEMPRRERDRRWYGALAIVLSVTLFVFGIRGLGALVAGGPLFGGGQ
jgi:hypothetical protein